MRNTLSKLALSVSVLLALTFTFGCSSSEKSNDEAEYQPAYPPASDDPSLISIPYAHLFYIEDDDPPFGRLFTDFNVVCVIPGSSRGQTCAYWMSNEAKKWTADNLFRLGNVAGFLPVPKGMNARETNGHYPSSVGTIFSIADNINNEVANILTECEGSCKTKDEKPLTNGNIAESITMYASVYYDKTAHSDPVVANCTDRVFQSSQAGNSVYLYGNNCLGNQYNFYLAWDLKNNSGKLIKVGSYKAATKFYWQIEYIDATDNLKSKKFDQKEFTDTFEMYCDDPEGRPNSDSEKKCQSKGGYRPWPEFQ